MPSPHRILNTTLTSSRPPSGPQTAAISTVELAMTATVAGWASGMDSAPSHGQGPAQEYVFTPVVVAWDEVRRIGPERDP